MLNSLRKILPIFPLVYICAFLTFFCDISYALTVRPGEKIQDAINIASEGECGLKRAKFDLIKLGNNMEYSKNTGNDEVAFVIISGHCNIKGPNYSFDGINRGSVFTSKRK